MRGMAGRPAIDQMAAIAATAGIKMFPRVLGVLPQITRINKPCAEVKSKLGVVDEIVAPTVQLGRRLRVSVASQVPLHPSATKPSFSKQGIAASNGFALDVDWPLFSAPTHSRC